MSEVQVRGSKSLGRLGKHAGFQFIQTVRFYLGRHTVAVFFNFFSVRSWQALPLRYLPVSFRGIDTDMQ